MNITSMSAVDLYKTLADPVRVKAEFGSPESAANETRKFDKFESGVDSIESLMGLHSPSSFMYIKSGLGMSDSEIADHVGGIGKRLDAAYSEGKFTQEEYEELNESLNDYAEKLANKSKRMEASWAIARNMSPAQFSARTKRAENTSSEEFLAERKAQIDEYLKQNPVDMELLLKMINAVRLKTD